MLKMQSAATSQLNTFASVSRALKATDKLNAEVGKKSLSFLSSGQKAMMHLLSAGDFAITGPN